MASLVVEEEEMTCESLALTPGEGWAAHDVSANDGLSFPGGARAGERQAGLYCIETVPLPPMHRRLRQTDELPAALAAPPPERQGGGRVTRRGARLAARVWVRQYVPAGPIGHDHTADSTDPGGVSHGSRRPA